jgi:hypothetical protein
MTVIRERPDDRDSSIALTAAQAVVVQQDWKGWRKAMVPLSALRDVHWLQPAGAPQPLIHGYISCRDILSGEVTHECSDDEPHILLVCVIRSHIAPGVFERLSRQAGSTRSAELAGGLHTHEVSRPDSH